MDLDTWERDMSSYGQRNDNQFYVHREGERVERLEPAMVGIAALFAATRDELNRHVRK